MGARTHDTDQFWRHIIRMGVLEFGLAPAQIWDLSVMEWRWLVEPMGPTPGGALLRNGLHALARQFPDERV